MLCRPAHSHTAPCPALCSGPLSSLAAGAQYLAWNASSTLLAVSSDALHAVFVFEPHSGRLVLRVEGHRHPCLWCVCMASLPSSVGKCHWPVLGHHGQLMGRTNACQQNAQQNRPSRLNRIRPTPPPFAAWALLPGTTICWCIRRRARMCTCGVCHARVMQRQAAAEPVAAAAAGLLMAGKGSSRLPHRPQLRCLSRMRRTVSLCWQAGT